MKTFKEYFKEISESNQKVCDFINSLPSAEKEKLRIALMNHERTNYDGSWQADYFYGEYKKEAESDSKFIQSMYLKYNIKYSEEDMVKCFVKDPKKYFSKG